MTHIMEISADQYVTNHDFRAECQAAFDRCRFALVQAIMAEPPQDFYAFDGTPDLDEVLVDTSALEAALAELADITRNALRQVDNPYQHEQVLVSAAVSFLRDVVHGPEGFSGVMRALHGSRLAIEYMLRDDRVDVNSYCAGWSSESWIDRDDLPDGFYIEECQWCANDFPTDGAEDGLHFCSEECEEFFWGRD